MRRLWPLFSARKRVLASAEPLEDGVAAYQRADYATALKLLRPLAEQGNPKAQYNLGYMYAEGLSLQQDHAEAVQWFRMAAEQGNAGAQYNLGDMYGRGVFAPPTGSFSLGISQDIVQAQMWFILAATQGHKKAQIDQNGLAEEMTPDQIAEAQRMAREWRAKHQQ